MAKDYAAYYANENDSSALEQSVYLKLETTRGTLIAPAGTDFIYNLPASVSFSQPLESSPHKSGRHHTSDIKGKKTMSWTLPIMFNIDTSLPAADSDEIDPAARLLYKSALGKEDLTAGAVYDSSIDPSVSFSIISCGDKYSQQSRGCFVDQLVMTFPGDGNAQAEFSGMGAETFLVGIGKSTVANSANTVTLQAGEGKRFPVGSLVMGVKADGVTRSGDTPSGSARIVTAVAGDVVSVSGAPLTDMNGSLAAVYLCYYEPATKTAINNPQTGLVGSVTIASLSQNCVRNATVTIANAHEMVDNCFGYDALHGALFIPASRMTATLDLELNLNSKLIEFYNGVQAFESQDVSLVLGDAAGRHLLIEMPQVKFSVPEISVPETGSIPVSFSGGMCQQTALDAADEIKISFL